MEHHRYSQTTGQFWLVAEDGQTRLLGTGWAGNDSRPGANPKRIHGRNNPDAQALRCIGPLPQGWYRVGHPFRHPHLGQLAFPLEPDAGNRMFGRDGFYIHGAGGSDPANASEGCIIQTWTVREQLEQLVARGVGRLQVTQ